MIPIDGTRLPTFESNCRGLTKDDLEQVESLTRGLSTAVRMHCASKGDLIFNHRLIKVMKAWLIGLRTFDPTNIIQAPDA
jgi:hypothetical protein